MNVFAQQKNPHLNIENLIETSRGCKHPITAMPVHIILAVINVFSDIRFFFFLFSANRKIKSNLFFNTTCVEMQKKKKYIFHEYHSEKERSLQKSKKIDFLWVLLCKNGLVMAYEL